MTDTVKRVDIAATVFAFITIDRDPADNLARAIYHEIKTDDMMPVERVETARMLRTLADSLEGQSNGR